MKKKAGEQLNKLIPLQFAISICKTNFLSTKSVYHYFPASVLSLFFVLFSSLANANVTITVGGIANTSYTLSNLTFPAYTALGTIVILEGATNDISQTGGNLILDCPAGFEFQPGVGTASSTVAPDIVSAIITSVTAAQITISVVGNGAGTACCDQITITGIFVRAATLCPVAYNGNITKDGTSTQTITGVVNGTTSFGTLSQSTSSLATNAISGSPFCQGASLSVPFTACGFNVGNIFTAQLSDETGSFAAPVTIGTLSATASGTISAVIPGGTVPGAAYRIRIIAGNPVVTGADNGTNLTVNSPLITGTPSYVPVCPGAAIAIPFSVSGGCAVLNAGNVFTAQLSDAASSFATPV
ncbi:MAG: hypothetical protein ABI729_02495, partial [Chitinophagales bacterium]